jgi:hypothetical protein
LNVLRGQNRLVLEGSLHWIFQEALDNQIIAHKRKVLIGKGNVSHKQAIEKAEKEFEIYRKREMDLLESDFDREIKKLKDKK